MMHCVVVMREVRLVLLGNYVHELFILMPLGVIKNSWDRLTPRNHMIKIIVTGRVVAQRLGPKIFGKPQRKPNLMRPDVPPPLADL